MQSEHPAKNICLLIEYDGSPYGGWQMQKDRPSIQAEFLKAIHSITGEQVRLVVAGRTDAGVHAHAQVANFMTHSRLEARRFAPALNRYLPDSISVHRSIEVAHTFNARLDSLSKHYRYRIYQGGQRAALEAKRAWHVKAAPLNIEAMRQAASLLIGDLDFESFRSVHCDAEHAKRHMYEISISSSPRPPIGQHIDIVFHANAFCRHMCRILAGSLVEVGMGQKSVDDIGAALHQKKRASAGMTAPPEGLTLLTIEYPRTSGIANGF